MMTADTPAWEELVMQSTAPRTAGTSAAVGFRILVSVVSLVGLAQAGCNSSNKQSDGPISAVSQGDADQLNASRSKFDNATAPPFNADTRFAAGQLAESQGNVAAAMEQYKEALKLDPKHKLSIYRTGVLQAQLKQFPQAIETFKRYVEVTGGAGAAY